MALQFHVAVNIVERAVARLNVQLRVISFQVLILKIELHMSARQRFVRCTVVLHVVRLQTHFAVVNVHVVVRQVYIALPPLWPFGRNLGDAPRWRLG